MVSMATTTDCHVALPSANGNCIKINVWLQIIYIQTRIRSGFVCYLTWRIEWSSFHGGKVSAPRGKADDLRNILQNQLICANKIRKAPRNEWIYRIVDMADRVGLFPWRPGQSATWHCRRFTQNTSKSTQRCTLNKIITKERVDV